MKTTTIKIATTFTAAIAAGAKGIVTVITAADSSRLRWRCVSRVQYPGVVGQGFAWLVDRLGMHRALQPAMICCRPVADASRDRQPSNRFANRPLAAL
ncbi:hypothetical protein [Botrimarina sp.]|uniref:hypothetical protein n=1 Tax=Botrimarina sp. TaxID=2795802 RepID=UPI0032EDB3D4